MNRWRQTQSSRCPRNRYGKSANSRGMVLIVVLSILGALAIGSAALVQMGMTDIRMAGQYSLTTVSFYAAESGIARALSALKADDTWTGTTGQLGNGSAYAVDVTTPSPTVRLIESTGTYSNIRRTVSYKLVVDQITNYAIFAGHDLSMRGAPQVAVQGVRIGNDAYLELESGTQAFDLYRPAGVSVYMADATGIVTQKVSQPVDQQALKLKRTQWMELKGRVHPTYLHDTDGVFLTGDTDKTFNNLNFSAVSADSDGYRTVAVDGDVTLTGQLSGTGNLLATGRVVFDAGSSQGGGVVSIIASSDVRVKLSDSASENMHLYIYSEGSVLVEGGIGFTGSIIALGSVTVGATNSFAAEYEQAQWDAISPAYSMISSELHALAWEEARR